MAGKLTDQQRLARLLGGDDLAWLLARIRRKLERGESLDASVALPGATPEQRAAVQRLLGRRPRPGSTLTVSLPAVEDVLRRSGACPDGLGAAVVALTGAVTERAAAAAELDRSWQQAFAPLDATVEGRPELAGWLARVRSTGLVRRLAGTPESAGPLLADLAEVIRHLPAGGELLGRFAARVAGGAHALDDDRPLATLAFGAARALAGLPEGAGAEWRREVWAAVGLLRGEVSSTVLTLGLPGDPRTSTGRALAAWHQAGQPVVLTLRQLVRDPPGPTAAPTAAPSGQVVSAPTGQPVSALAGQSVSALAGQSVFVCENPVVVSAAADRLGPGCHPLVCTGGQPGAAVLHLLRHLARAGATLHYHGDFDWGGIRIGNVVFDRLPARPWRFRTTDYLAAADRGRALSGDPASARWDDRLGAAMAETGAAVEEEQVIDDLLGDLAR